MRKRGWIIVPTVLALVLSLAAVNMVTPRYKSEARILIDGRENVFLRPNGERSEERTALDAEAVTSQVQLVLSRDLAREIIRKNKLAERPEFDPVLQGILAAEVAAGPGRHRPRPVLADAGRARAGSLLRSLHGLCGRQVPRHRRRIPVARSRTCRARRQLDRRRLSGAAAGRAAGAGQIREPVAVGRNREPAQEGRRSRIARRGFPFQVEPVRRHQQHHAVQPADGRDQHAAEQRARAEVGRGVQGAADPRNAAERQADRGFRSAQFRTDPPAVRTAGDAARAACRTVVDAARRPSPHQGIEGAARRSRPPVARGGRQGLALAGQRRAHRRRPGRRPDARASIS